MPYPETSAAPDIFENTHPVLAHDLANAAFGPARLFHPLRQVRKITDARKAVGKFDRAEFC